MEGRPDPARRAAPAQTWVHDCERCGTRMEERHCKIVCTTCGYCRDCSDP